MKNVTQKAMLASGVLPRTLTRAVVGAAQFTTNDELRQVLRCVYVGRREDGNIDVVGTDTYVLFHAVVPFSSGKWLQPGKGECWLLPAEPLTKALGSSQSRAASLLAIDDGAIIGGRIVKLDEKKWPLDAKIAYPRWDKVVPAATDHLSMQFTGIRLGVFVDAVRLAMTAARQSDDRCPIMLSVGMGGRLVVSGYDPTTPKTSSMPHARETESACAAGTIIASPSDVENEVADEVIVIDANIAYNRLRWIADAYGDDAMISLRTNGRTDPLNIAMDVAQFIFMPMGIEMPLPNIDFADWSGIK